MRPVRSSLPALLVLLLATLTPSLWAQSPTSRTAYLPLIAVAPGGGGPAPATGYRVNAPYHGAGNLDSKFGELAIFWFGKVTTSQNYADVRVGYSASELYLYAAVFDRRIWFDGTPQAADLSSWDALTLALDTGQASALGATSHRFVAQMSGDGGGAYQQAYSATGGAWAPDATPFTARPGWRGENLNDNSDDRGWAMTFRIPFSSLGLQGPPASGASWRMALELHDRDDAAGTPIAAQTWPPTANSQQPQTWGTLRFGLPVAEPPTVAAPERYTIRQGLAGATVPDAAVGGGAVCGDGLDFWSAWGDSARDAGKGDFNVQNQSDIADWPCFSKYFVTFPLEALPPGKTVVSATLVLHQFGNAEPSQAKPSLLQALLVDADWNEATLSWNSAPLAVENIGQGWVAPLASTAGWPGVPRTIDVTRGVALAYGAGGPLRLAIYSADSDYHSGKYFVSSDTGDWNAVGRPTLLVTLGTPSN